MSTLDEQLRRLPAELPDLFIAVDVAVMFSFNAALTRAATADLSCVICGCTNYRACVGGCAWWSLDPPICSECAIT